MFHFLKHCQTLNKFLRNTVTSRLQGCIRDEITQLKIIKKSLEHYLAEFLEIESRAIKITELREVSILTFYSIPAQPSARRPSLELCWQTESAEPPLPLRLFISPSFPTSAEGAPSRFLWLTGLSWAFGGGRSRGSWGHRFGQSYSYWWSGSCQRVLRWLGTSGAAGAPSTSLWMSAKWEARISVIVCHCGFWIPGIGKRS